MPLLKCLFSCLFLLSLLFWSFLLIKLTLCYFHLPGVSLLRRMFSLSSLLPFLLPGKFLLSAFHFSVRDVSPRQPFYIVLPALEWLQQEQPSQFTHFLTESRCLLLGTRPINHICSQY